MRRLCGCMVVNYTYIDRNVTITQACQIRAVRMSRDGVSHRRMYDAKTAAPQSSLQEKCQKQLSKIADKKSCPLSFFFFTILKLKPILKGPLFYPGGILENSARAVARRTRPITPGLCLYCLLDLCQQCSTTARQMCARNFPSIFPSPNIPGSTVKKLPNKMLTSEPIFMAICVGFRGIVRKGLWCF